MGLVLFVIFAVLEVVLVIWICRKEREKKEWRRMRTLVRAAQAAVTLIAILLPFGQKWRVIPVFIFLLILLLIAGLVMYLKKNRADGNKGTAGAVVSGILSMVFSGIFLIPAFIFTGYKGLPVTGEYKILQASAILTDSSRKEQFENDGSFREIPVHFYYPEVTDTDAAGFPLIVFSH